MKNHNGRTLTREYTDIVMGAFRVKRAKGYVWAYEFQHHGVRYKGEGYLTRAEAVIAEGEKRREMKAKPQDEFPTISLGELADRYLIECQTVKGLAKNTIQQKMFVIESFMDFLGDDPPAECITRNLVKEYLKIRVQLSKTDKSNGNCAANRDKKEIKALFNWANDEDIIFCPNPCKGIPDFPEDEFQKYVPPKKDILEVKLNANADERDFLDCVYYLLGRRREIRFLRWQDINFQTGWVDLFTRKKGGGLKRMPKPMNDEVVRILERRSKKRVRKDIYVFNFSLRELDRMLPHLCKEAGVTPFGLHALRHHAASSLLEKGHSIKDIQFLLGHERASTTERYLHVTTGDFHRLVNSLQGEVPRCPTL